MQKGGKLIDLRSSAEYRKAHVEGALWGIRPRLDRIAAAGERVALMAESAERARLAAVDLLAAGVEDVRVLEGDLAACRSAGVPVIATPNVPADSERIDFLFFVHDRHEGNKAAMRGYLAWETGLLGQLDDDERASFQLPTGAH
jgi:rhodanese-related sulfurtransferase